jgi:hypothetical protein
VLSFIERVIYLSGKSVTLGAILHRTRYLPLR